MWGTMDQRISNILEGVSTGFIKELELVGVGYKAASKGNNIELLLGYFSPNYFRNPQKTLK